MRRTYTCWVRTAPEANADELASGPDTPAGRRSVPTNVWRAAGFIGVLVIVAVVGPGLLSSSNAPTPAPDSPPSLPPIELQSQEPRAPAPLDWAVRGDLADDKAFVEAALARVKQQDVAATKVLLAATLPDGARIAFVALARSDPVSDLGRGVHMRALHVPKGERVGDAVPTPLGRLLDPTDLTGWAGRSASGRVSLVVLSEPRPLALEASPLIHYHRNGGATRRWVPVSGDDGWVLVDLGRRTDQVVAVRHAALQARTYPLVLTVAGDPRARSRVPAPEPSQVRGLLSSSYRGPAPWLVVQALATGHEHRFRPTDADLRVIWSGEVEPGRRAAVIRARRNDGPVFQLLVTTSKGGVTSFAPRHVRWSDGDLIPWLFVQGDPSASVLLLNPSGRGTAVLSEAGSPSRTIPIGADGIGEIAGTRQGQMYTSLSSARLAILSPGGEMLVSSSLPELGVDDVLVLR